MVLGSPGGAAAPFAQYWLRHWIQPIVFEGAKPPILGQGARNEGPRADVGLLGRSLPALSTSYGVWGSTPVPQWGPR